MEIFVKEYEQVCRIFAVELKKAAQKLHQDVEGSRIGDDPYNYYVPPENWKEAERRVEFVYSMLKKYHRILYSRQKLLCFVGMLNRRIAKLEGKIEERDAQIAFDFMGIDDLEAMEKERDELKEMKRICVNPDKYFDAPHHIHYSS